MGGDIFFPIDTDRKVEMSGLEPWGAVRGQFSEEVILV